MRFQKGSSGNPLGRPKGQTPGAKIRASIEKRSTDILNSVIEAAIGGDMQACKMLLDRLVPPLKGQSVPVILPVTDGLAQQGQQVIDGALSGKIPADVAANLMSSIMAQSKIIEIDELVKRVERLEKL